MLQGVKKLLRSASRRQVVSEILDEEFYLNIDIGLDYKISIAGLYSIYSTEMKMVNEWRLDKFWDPPDFDNYNLNRKLDNESW